jgi:catechol 2,3-dioxygenase-like lactoylglutathione lyase family enzyme
MEHGYVLHLERATCGQARFTALELRPLTATKRQASMSKKSKADKMYIVGGVELPRPFVLRRLGHVGTFQSDLGAARRFYVDQLGFLPSDDLVLEPGEPSLGFFMTHGTDHHSFACLDEMMVKGRDPHFDGGVSINQVSFQVGTLEEVKRGHDYFKECGCTVFRVGRDSPGSNWAVYVEDPDGHNVELFYGMEQIGWDRRSKPLPARIFEDDAPALPQRSERQELEDVEKQGASLTGGFRPEDPRPYAFDVGGVMLQRPYKVNRVGPVYLFVKDTERSVAFYRDVMGMSLTESVEWGGHTVHFLRCNTDHHAVGLFPEAARSALGRDGRNTTLAIGVELGSYQQLRAAREHLLSQGAAPAPALPSALHPGIERTALFMDPAGHAVMLFCGMEQVGWDGRPRPADRRKSVGDDWPDVLPSATDTYASPLSTGPLG